MNKYLQWLISGVTGVCLLSSCLFETKEWQDNDEVVDRSVDVSFSFNLSVDTDLRLTAGMQNVSGETDGESFFSCPDPEEITAAPQLYEALILICSNREFPEEPVAEENYRRLALRKSGNSLCTSPVSIAWTADGEYHKLLQVLIVPKGGRLEDALYTTFYGEEGSGLPEPFDPAYGEWLGIDPLPKYICIQETCDWQLSGVSVNRFSVSLYCVESLVPNSYDSDLSAGI